MPELLLELGCEELPAGFVRKAVRDLAEAIAGRLRDAGIEFADDSAKYATPRRLIVCFSDVAAEQPGKSEEKRGPSASAAYDQSGNPTAALLGFCKSQGVDPGQARVEGDYVWATKATPGRPADEVLAELLPDAIRSLAFEKAMRWGTSRMRFARPIRWVLASFGGVTVPFEIEGVRAGLQSRGHRFFHPAPFEAASLADLLAGLRERKVEPDPGERERRIRDGATRAAAGEPLLADALVEENVFLTEWPEAHDGEFRTEFLELPEPVLVTAMAKHERFFPVRDTARGKLANRFVSIRNGGEEAAVRAGNEWVLNARFNDARFFFEEDKRLSMSEFLERTAGIVFQEKLGTIRQRADRLSELAAKVADETRDSKLTDEEHAREVDWARQAGLYCKADLSTGLVSELASLQGVVGGEYAKREGFPDPVCWAIASHYDPDKNPKIECAGARTAVRVLIADQIDKLAGFLGIGLAPSGSSDPFGLRRSATMLVEAALSWNALSGGYTELLRSAALKYGDQGFELDSKRAEETWAGFFRARYESAFPDARPDVLEGAIGGEDPHASLKPRTVRFRLACLASVYEDVPFVRTMTRPINIVRAAREKSVPVGDAHDLSKLAPNAWQSAEGTELFETCRRLEDGDLASALSNEDPAAYASSLRELVDPINRFFDSTMVMVKDENVRFARLTLLAGCASAILEAGDFSKIVIEGD